MNKFKKLTLALFFLLTLLTPTSGPFRFGLISRNQEEQSPSLLDLKTKALLQGPYAEIQYIHTYKNPYDHALETEFYFPRTENSVFHKFEAVFRNQTIVGEILEKTKAKEKYEWNVEQGNTVAYSERNTLTPDVMKIQVGNIPANESVEIIFSVIQPLEVIINKFWGFTLPSVLTERYTPSSVDLLYVSKVIGDELFLQPVDRPSACSLPSSSLPPSLFSYLGKVLPCLWIYKIFSFKNFSSKTILFCKNNFPLFSFA